ncbi:MAG: homoserine O-acetyltransferase [Candidatus Methylacidiphilales bacterium]|nr:homoserine O-acetyltransferase [Candidatus Methylacidiphilales bacterium]
MSHTPPAASTAATSPDRAHSHPALIGRTQYFTLGRDDEGGFTFECGQTLPQLTLAYQTYGTLNPARDNAIYIFHALSGDAHVAGVHQDDGRTGWWDLMVGPGKAFDTDLYYIICANIPGGCKGSTGPSSVEPSTGKPFGMRFPVTTVHDMARAQQRLVTHLGITQLLATVGASMGGMQALAHAELFPGATRGVICVAVTGKFTSQAIAWDEIGRRAIMMDPDWHSGEYYGRTPPVQGLAVARMVAHVTYLSESAMERKFSRRRQFREEIAYGFDVEFAVESYLAYQGRAFHQRFDANSYLYITRATDYFVFGGEWGSYRQGFEKSDAKFLFLAYTSDWLFPPSQVEELPAAAKEAGRDAEYYLIDVPHGHDSFLLEAEPQETYVRAFLDKLK